MTAAQSLPKQGPGPNVHSGVWGKGNVPARGRGTALSNRVPSSPHSPLSLLLVLLCLRLEQRKPQHLGELRLDLRLPFYTRTTHAIWWTGTPYDAIRCDEPRGGHCHSLSLTLDGGQRTHYNASKMQVCRSMRSVLHPGVGMERAWMSMSHSASTERRHSFESHSG